MARKQIKLTFQIGYDQENKAFEAALVASASYLCGGCTTTHATGWWMEDGASHSERFTGNLEQEHCFQLELTTELHKADKVYTSMQQSIVNAVELLGVATNWIHVTETEMTGRHFSVQDILASRKAAA